jgi:ABC-2 type transport system permease protein
MKKKKQMPYGLYHLLTCVLAVVMAVLLILVSERAEDKWYLKADVSSDGVTQLSDYTCSHLDALEEDVLLYPVFSAAYDSTVRDLVTETLAKMSAVCEHIHVEEIDPVTQPQRITALSGDAQSVENGTIFITNEDGTRIIRLEPDDLLFSRTVMDEEYTIYCGEAQLIGAISRVCTENPVGVWFITGHGEASEEDCSLLALQLRSNGFDVHSGELGRISPAATDILLLIDPQNDLTGDEAQTLVSFLDDGGRALIACGADTPLDRLTQLRTVCSLYGLDFQSGWVVESTQESTRYVDSPEYLSPALADALAEDVTGRVILPRACALATPAIRPSVTVTKLLETSTRAVLHPNADGSSLDAQDNDTSGQFLLGAVAKKSSGTALCLLSSADMFKDATEISGASVLDASDDLDLLTWCVTDMSDLDQTASLDAGVKRLAAQRITFDNASSRQRVTILSIALVPCILLIVMAVVLLKRRRL